MIGNRDPWCHLHRIGLFAAAAWAAMLAGCAPALSSLQPAHVAPRGHVQAEMGVDVSVPTGTIGDVVDAGRALAEAARERDLTGEEEQLLLRAGTALALNPPSLTQHVAVAYTALDRLEVRLRYSGAAWRMGGRYQILERGLHPLDLSIGMGISRYLLGFPLGDTFDEVLSIDDLSRWEVDIPVIAGISGSFYRLWAGPRILLTRFSTGIALTIPATDRHESVQSDGRGYYLGAQAGLALGYRWLFVAAELTVVHLGASARIIRTGGDISDLSIDDTIIYPTIGLMGEL